MGLMQLPYLQKIIETRELFNRLFLDTINEVQPDLIVLAGFLVVIPKEMIAQYRNRIINIHPSLIPSFCGTGYYGLKVHEAALERGVKVTGATVHFVDEGTDTGPIHSAKGSICRTGRYSQGIAAESHGTGRVADTATGNRHDRQWQAIDDCRLLKGMGIIMKVSDRRKWRKRTRNCNKRSKKSESR